MIGIILAIALSQPLPTDCKVVGFSATNTVEMVCGGKDELSIPIGEWPAQWEGPHLGGDYETDAQGQPIPTKLRPGLQNSIRANSDLHRERFQRQPLNCSPVPQRGVVCR